MDIGWCCVCVRDDPKATINGAMIEVKEPLGLAVAHHVAAFGVSPGYLGALFYRLPFASLERLEVMFSAVVFDRAIERIPVIAARLGDQLRIPTIARMYSDLMPRSVPI